MNIVVYIGANSNKEVRIDWTGYNAPYAVEPDVFGGEIIDWGDGWVATEEEVWVAQ